MKVTTREKLLSAAYALFYKNGYQGTGIDEILKSASLHKGSLYHLFKSKKALLLAVIEEVIARNLQRKYAQLEQCDAPLETLFKVLHDVSAFDFRHGCALNNLVQEMSPLDEEIAKALSAVYTDLEGYYVMALRETALENKAALAKMMVATVEGAIMAAKSAQSPEPYFEIIDELERMVKRTVSFT